jgi:glycolate oxidase FAD binding subunit
MSDRAAVLVDQVRDALAARRPLTIRGGGSKPHILGRLPDGELVEVGAHRGIVAYQPTELVLTARAGTPLDEIEAALAENGQGLSFEPPHLGPGATLGGTLACNLSGPARPWGGSVRDMVLGVRLINGKGEHLRFGGQVMKNVAGFDLSRLQAGAMGTLGVITEISLKVLPRPRASVTLVEDMDEGAAIARMNRLAGKPAPLSGAAWVDERLYLRFSGSFDPATIAGRWGGRVLGGAESFWADLREQRLPFFAGEHPLWRLSLGSATPPLHAGPTVIDWGGALRWLRGGEPESLAAKATRAGGHAVMFRGAAVPSRPPLPPLAAELHRRLKVAFDPQGLFNPGRLYPGL